MRLPSQIESFLKVAHYCNFTQAAEALHITTTAVSKQIKLLEAEINEQLFIRTTRKVVLTEFGELLYQRCQLLADELQSIQQFIECKKSQPQGVIKVLVSTILSKAFVLKHLAAFMQQYPMLEPEIILTEEDSALSRDDIDIMVGFPQIPPFTDQYRYRKMFKAHNILCASPSYIKQFGEIKKPEDLLSAKIISHTLRKDNFNMPMANGKRLPCAKPILFMNQFDALNQMCCAGVGLFLTGDVLVQNEIASGQLIRVLPQIEFAHYDIFMFYRRYDYEQPKIRAFVDFYMAELVA